MRLISILPFSAASGTVIFDGTSALTKSYAFYGLTIAAASSLDTAGFTVAILGTFANQGTLYRVGGDSVSQTDSTEGTVTYRGSGGAIQSYGGAGDYYNLTLGNGVAVLAFTLAGAIQVNNDFGITTNSTLGGNPSIAIAGNWSKSATGTFTAGTGTVSFVNAAKTTVVSGATAFNNLSITTAGKTVQFTAGQTQVVANLTATGTSGNLIVLAGATNATWTVNAAASAVSYAKVSWSTAGTAITSYTSTDNGNNVGWIFSTTFT